MPSQDEKSRRKQILDELTKKQREEFEQSLPMTRDKFRQLFDCLDAELEECDDTLKLTRAFLSSQKIDNVDETKKWLGEHGANCDCEVLANTEEEFN